MTKYSIKNICLGIGLGLVIASMANISMAPKGLTIDEIRKEASKHNLIVMDAKDIIQKQPEQPAPAPEEQPKAPEPQEQNKSVKIVIESGSTSEGVAQKLLNNKLIESKQAFLQRLSELKKENKMQIGSFEIPAGASIDSIIEIITSIPR